MAHEAVETLDLVVFLAVARTGSFGAAAGELRLSTPSVSARMAALEHKLTTELFTRTTRGSSLTPAGQRLVPYARRCLEVLEEGHHAVRADEHRRVTVAAPASLGTIVFPPVLRVLSDASLSAHCRVAHSAEVVGYLLDGTVDVGFVLNRMVPAGIITHRLCRSALVPICHPEHPLARRQSVTVDDLCDARIAVYRWNHEAEALAEVFAHPRRPAERSVHLLGLPSAILDVTIDASHIGIIPEFASIAPLRSGTVVELPLTLPGWSLDVQLAYHRDTAETAGVTALLAAEPTITDTIRR